MKDDGLDGHILFGFLGIPTALQHGEIVYLSTSMVKYNPFSC
jgi:hypothetical protein